ncbi:MAG: hypothetical protein JXB30_03300 [Anaerolineae bacterium]|nr:hypothetical protein [Anaerolineae bacterium]
MIVPTIARLIGIPEGLICALSIVGGIAIGLGVNWVIERILLTVWPSGRQLMIDEEGITLQERSGKTIRLKWSAPIDVRSWHFVVPKERGWVRKGWYCMACRLAQEDRVFVPYSFMDSAEAETLPQWSAFPELISSKHAARPENKHLLSRIGKQEPLREAENDRWDKGAEMSPADFTAILAEIDRRVPDWPTKRVMSDKG